MQDPQTAPGECFLTVLRRGQGPESLAWTELLLGQYRRFCERQGYSVSLIDVVEREHGVASTTLGIAAPGCVAALAPEHGVHELARVPPHSPATTPVTSFATVEVAPALVDPGAFELREQDVRFQLKHALGSSSARTPERAVRVLHAPTRLTVTCELATQIESKELALRVLRARLARRAQAGALDERVKTYTLDPFQQVVHHGTGAEALDVARVLDGDWSELHGGTSLFDLSSGGPAE